MASIGWLKRDLCKVMIMFVLSTADFMVLFCDDISFYKSNLLIICFVYNNDFLAVRLGFLN